MMHSHNFLGLTWWSGDLVTQTTDNDGGNQKKKNEPSRAQLVNNVSAPFNSLLSRRDPQGESSRFSWAYTHFVFILILNFLVKTLFVQGSPSNLYLPERCLWEHISKPLADINTATQQQQQCTWTFQARISREKLDRMGRAIRHLHKREECGAESEESKSITERLTSAVLRSALFHHDISLVGGDDGIAREKLALFLLYGERLSSN